METTFFCLGIMFTMLCAFVGTLLRPRKHSKYCPKCGRMLMVHEMETYKIVPINFK
jgi:hypothetical protein